MSTPSEYGWSWVQLGSHVGQTPAARRNVISYPGCMIQQLYVETQIDVANQQIPFDLELAMHGFPIDAQIEQCEVAHRSKPNRA